MTVRRISSRSIEGNALAYWRDIASDVFVPLSCCVDTRLEERCRFDVDTLGDLRFVQIGIAPHVVRRTRSDVNRSENAFFIVSQQMSGSGVVVQDGRETVTCPGAIVVYDTTRPYELHFPVETRQRIVRIPHALFAEKLSRADQIRARGVDCRSALGKLCQSFLTTTFSQVSRLDAASAPLIADTLTSLLCSALRGSAVEDRIELAIPAHALRQRIIKYIEVHLADAELSVESMAAALGLSPRYIQLLMQQVGTTASHLIWSCRLERSAEALAQPRFGAAAVAQIGFAYGFKDPAHFSRAFKKRFGIPPGQYQRDNVARNG